MVHYEREPIISINLFLGWDWTKPRYKMSAHNDNSGISANGNPIHPTIFGCFKFNVEW